LKSHASLDPKPTKSSKFTSKSEQATQSKMSTLAKNTALVLLGAVGAAAAINTLKPSKTAGIANRMRTQLDQINTHVEQDKSDTILDRTEILKDVKRRKPWNQTSAEREAMRRTGDGDWKLRNEGE